MRRRLYPQLAALTLLPLMAAGCAMPPHSNMMVFGTNTSLAVRVGASATSVPEISVGYSRQEAVLMPLVANKAGTSGTGSSLIPCDVSAPVTVTGSARFLKHPCLLVGQHGDSQDTYSVLASFGANIKGTGKKDEVGVGVGLAQYFATGVAAQMLALSGGASVVAIGPAAQVSADNRPSASAIQALMSTPSERATAELYVRDYQAAALPLIDKIASAPSKAIIDRELSKFETAVGATFKLWERCDGPKSCADKLREDSAIYDSSFSADRAKFNAAVAAWNNS